MSPQAGFVLLNKIVPRLKSAIPNTVCFVGCEDAQESIQDATAFAAKLLHSAEAAGRRVTPGNIAYYVILHMRSSRRSTGSSVVDVMATGTQLNGHTHLVSLEELLPMEDWQFETVADDSGTKHGLWLHSMNGGVDAVCEFIQHLLQKFDSKSYVTFEWSHDCSKPRVDAYGAGAAFITAKEIKSMSTAAWLNEQIA